MSSIGYRIVLVALSFVMVAAGLAVAAEPSSGDVPLVGEKIRQLMQDRDYTAAIRAIEQAASSDKAPRDYLTYLKGRALFLDKQYDEAN